MYKIKNISSKISNLNILKREIPKRKTSINSLVEYFNKPELTEDELIKLIKNGNRGEYILIEKIEEVIKPMITSCETLLNKKEYKKFAEIVNTNCKVINIKVDNPEEFKKQLDNIKSVEQLKEIITVVDMDLSAYYTDLELRTKKELIKICKFNNIKVNNSLTKKQIIEKIEG